MSYSAFIAGKLGVAQSNDDYLDFLLKKIPMAKFDGYDIDDSAIHPLLKPHQRDCVRWAVKGGNRALFESFGLGKSLQQLEIVRLTKIEADGHGLIVCPQCREPKYEMTCREAGV